MDELIDNEYFDILKTKNVYLIDYSDASIKKAINTTTTNLSIEELPQELLKVNLKIPSNYGSNHSIANEWGAYRLMQVNDIPDNKKMFDKFDSNLYYKWLNTIHQISNESKEEVKKKSYAPKLKGPTVLGKIDLTATKNKR